MAFVQSIRHHHPIEEVCLHPGHEFGYRWLAGKFGAQFKHLQEIRSCRQFARNVEKGLELVDYENDFVLFLVKQNAKKFCFDSKLILANDPRPNASKLLSARPAVMRLKCADTPFPPLGTESTHWSTLNSTCQGGCSPHPWEGGNVYGP